MAFGRNCQAQEAFEAEMHARRFSRRCLRTRELHPDFAPPAVSVFEWRRLARPSRRCKRPRGEVA